MYSNYFFSGHSENFWINLLGFNLIWSLSIFLGNLALPYVVTLLVLHILFHTQPQVELQVILLTGLMGYSVDCLLTLAGFFRFEAVQGVTPLWLLFLWFSFCATLRQSLVFFRKTKFLTAAFGALGGSFAYMMAAHFQAVEFSHSFLLSGFSLALIWLLLFPSLIWFSKEIEERLCA